MEIVSLASTHAVAVWRNVLIQIWERPLDPLDQAREFRRVLRTFERQAALKSPARPLLALTVVSETTTMPDAESRRIATDFASYFDYYVGAHEGTGFRASLVRAVVAGMALAARVKPRYDVCSDARHGAALIASRSSGTVFADELYAVITELRARIAAS